MSDWQFREDLRITVLEFVEEADVCVRVALFLQVHQICPTRLRGICFDNSVKTVSYIYQRESAINETVKTVPTRNAYFSHNYKRFQRLLKKTAEHSSGHIFRVKQYLPFSRSPVCPVCEGVWWWCPQLPGPPKGNALD